MSLVHAAVSCILIVSFASCTQEYKTIDYTDSTAQHVKLPFVKEYKHANKDVLVYGSYHTTGPTDSEIADIEAKLGSLQPDIILYEGDYIGLGRTKHDAVSNYFEMGFVRWWAAQHATKELNIEPAAIEKNRYLLHRYLVDDMLLAFVLDQNTLYMKQHSKEEFEVMYPAIVGALQNEGLPLDSAQKTIAHFYMLYRSFYNKQFDPATFDYATVNIKFNKTRLNRINQAAATYRDQYMLHCIDSSLSRYHKVYVQVGGRHALAWQPAFKQIMSGH